ncbi:MAG: hypothetical protein RLZZ15_4167 [Verrucomicrobiota bacterium]
MGPSAAIGGAILFFLGSIVAAAVMPWSPKHVLMWLGSHVFLYVGMSVCSHRYFSHRSFATSRPFQAVLAGWSACTMQGGPLVWAAWHRPHHRHCDQEDDLHSPRPLSWRAVLHAHVGWIGDIRTWDTARDATLVRDFMRFPEVVGIQRYEGLVGLAYIAAWTGLAGWPGLVFGWLLPHTTAFHCTATINSLSHIFGSRAVGKSDCHAGNVWWALPLQLGENWHANHHEFPSRSNRGIRWWEVDPIHWFLLGLQALGLIWDIRSARDNPEHPAGHDPEIP